MICPETLRCSRRQSSLATGHSFAMYVVTFITLGCAVLSAAQDDTTISSWLTNESMTSGSEPCNNSFMLIGEMLPFHEAQDMCRSYNYSGLAVIRTPQDLLLFLRAIGGYNRTSDELWVGLSSDSPEQALRWDDEVNDTGPIRGRCGTLNSSAHIGHENCNLCLKSVCSDYVDSKEGFAIFDDERLEYDEASQKCLDKGYDRLAILDSKEKMEYVIEEMRKLRTMHHQVEVWIGMTVTDLDHFQWASGEEVTWAEWSPYEEPDFLDTQKCVRLSYKAFATKSCTDRKHAVCENAPRSGCLVHNVAPERPFRSFTSQVELRDRFPANSTEVISAQPVRSLIECVTQCADTSGCRSLAFHQDTHVCASFVRRYDASHISSSDLKYAPQWTVLSKCG